MLPKHNYKVLQKRQLSISNSEINKASFGQKSWLSCGTASFLSQNITFQIFSNILL